ncbi:MAG TPA: hemolysin family protein, partial [Burkholderiales bacterium]|nr:hemolysin family protein [Burkholderiales bacterium]
MDVAILLALILLNGAFAMSEIALVAARKGRLQPLADERDAGALAALRLREEPTQFLSTIQIGITSIGILNGIVGEEALAPLLVQWLHARGLEGRFVEYAATAAVVVLITYFSIVLGELVPKRLGQLDPEAVARRVARPMELLARLARPFVALLAGSTRLVLRSLGIRDARERPVTEEEIHALLVEGSESGAIEEEEHDIVRNVFRLDDRQIGSLMVPRSDVVSLDASLPWEENVRRIEDSRHTRYPVVRGSLREVVGVISARGLLRRALRGQAPQWETDAQPPVFVPESLTGMELLQNFRASGVQLAFVVDEYGEVLGIVTLRDVLEAITGEFRSGRAADQWAVMREDGSWLLDGLLPIPELKDRLGLKALPEEERYHTLSGLLMMLLGRLP